jgi:hypothetical protein
MVAFTTKGVMAQERQKRRRRLKSQKRKYGPATVLFENDRVRVVETRTKPGEGNAMQERPDRVIYHFNAGKQRVHYLDGKTEDREFKPGSVEFRKRDTTSRRILGRPKFTI